MLNDKKISKEYIYQGRLGEIEKQIIDFFVKIGEHRYLNPKFSMIFGYLIIHHSLSQSELSELTGYSIATVSNTLRLMVSLNLANKRLRPNSHEYEYYLFGENKSLTPQSSKFKLESVQTALDFFSQKKQQLEKSNLQERKGYSLLHQRIEELLNFLNVWKSMIEYQKLLFTEFMKKNQLSI